LSGKTIFNGLLFVVFFTAGMAAVSLAVLVLELGSLYRDKAVLSKIEAGNKVNQKLDDQYAYQIDQIKKNPAVLARLRVLNLGEEPQDPQTAYPQASNERLIQAARFILARKDEPKKDEAPLIPDWLVRASQTRARWALFLTGTALIITSMTFFSSREEHEEHESPNQNPTP
jgi:hypothetical protein